MYSVHVSSDQNRRSSTKRYTTRFNEHRTRQQRPSIRISNANQLIRYVRDNLFNLCSSQSSLPGKFSVVFFLLVFPFPVFISIDFLLS